MRLARVLVVAFAIAVLALAFGSVLLLTLLAGPPGSALFHLQPPSRVEIVHIPPAGPCSPPWSRCSPAPR